MKIVNNKVEFETFEEVRQNDPTVASASFSGFTFESLVVLLANQKKALVDEYIKLESIAPRKYKLPDGRMVVWHCPDDLVPIRNLGA